MDFSEEEILSLALENNEVATNIIYEKYKYIVEVLLKQYHNQALKCGIDLKELEQEANIAFTDAIRSYRDDKNTKLSTFVTLCIDRRLKKIIKKNSGEKAKFLNTTYSLDYDYNDGCTTLQDIVSDCLQNDPLHNLTQQENYKELTQKIKNTLSESEYEIFNYLINEFDYQRIAELTGKTPKQVDNAIQRLKHKIRDIIME